VDAVKIYKNVGPDDQVMIITVNNYDNDKQSQKTKVKIEKPNIK